MAALSTSMRTSISVAATQKRTGLAAIRPLSGSAAIMRTQSYLQVPRSVVMHAEVNPVRQAIGGLVSGIYQVSASLAAPEPGLSPLWTSLKKLDVAGVKSAIQSRADLNERNAEGDTPLLYIARQGHYKYQPAGIPAALIAAGADKDAKDKTGLTALEVSLIAGWQNISEPLLKAGASTAGVSAIKSRLTCPDCKQLVAEYSL
eukprot:CAMPEP_0119101124 /NCGR_PEP_ID=MMETSP1180-20130426/257_1 /TAXON_ID=3052 ORGANISM="Chlamydomonas cf sp, Strain CCMP681" /NCGR_SAMPLE_ID=MMETSP1180 /ASSEMBLY_ACC=CAM_ASM_000741 /LENGTH=202 /DNA_ID=CAMNT_0007085183 /DNA_START=21 /DNA_END=632 /DNA_ORIENTATION=+